MLEDFKARLVFAVLRTQMFLTLTPVGRRLVLILVRCTVITIILLLVLGIAWVMRS